MNSSTAPTIGLPAKFFLDAEIFCKAKEEIFYCTWQYACHASQLRDAGDYLCFSFCGQDLFVVRGGDGELRAFYNVCRHRGHKLLDGIGNCKTIVCPYHAWCYELDGRLRGAPNAHKVAGFAREKIHLAEVAVEDFLGFVFVNLDPAAPPMDDCYPEVRDAALKLCSELPSRAFAFEHSVNEGCNWLIAVENYNECYHCKVAHPDFARGVIDPASYDVARFGDGRCLRHTSNAASGDDAWYEMHDADYGAFYLWPAFALQVYPGAMVNAYCWRPLSVADTVVHRLWFSADGEVNDTLQKLIDRDRDTTFAEDLSLVRGVQRGVTSRGFAPGPLMVDTDGGVDSERSTATLHRWMTDAVGGRAS